MGARRSDEAERLLSRKGESNGDLLRVRSQYERKHLQQSLLSSPVLCTNASAAAVADVDGEADAFVHDAHEQAIESAVAGTMDAPEATIGRLGLPFRPKPIHAEWAGLLRAASDSELAMWLHKIGGLAPHLSTDCLVEVLARCHDARQRSLVDSGIVHGVIGAMLAHAHEETVQVAGCEALGLLASHPEHRLEQELFSAGALSACLTACAALPASERVLGAAFQTIANVCFAQHAADGGACGRKTAAVELGALEAVCEGIRMQPSAKWVHEAGVLAVASLCNGTDEKIFLRRARARAVGAISLAVRAAQQFPASHAEATHQDAYRAASDFVIQLHAQEQYSGPPV